MLESILIFRYSCLVLFKTDIACFCKTDTIYWFIAQNKLKTESNGACQVELWSLHFYIKCNWGIMFQGSVPISSIRFKVFGYFKKGIPHLRLNGCRLLYYNICWSTCFQCRFLLIFIMQLLKRIEFQLVYCYEPNTRPIVFFIIELITQQMPLVPRLYQIIDLLLLIHNAFRHNVKVLLTHVTRLRPG